MQRVAKVNINNIWTRIFYEDKTLKYEISIQLMDGSNKVYQVFSNYQKYREILNELIRAKDNNEYIDLLSTVQRVV
jgi:hypothetical protein